MNGHDFFPFGVRKVLNGMHDLYASVCNQHINAAELFDRLIHTGGHSCFVGHIHHDTHRFTACFNDLCRDSVCGGLIQIRNHDSCAFLCEGEGSLLVDRRLDAHADEQRPVRRGLARERAARQHGAGTLQEDAARRERSGEAHGMEDRGSASALALAREQAGAKPMPQDKVQGFMSQAVLGLSDAPLYAAPMALILKDFNHVQASVFQVARAPGKTVVYLGCLLLILGIFAMLYVRERRLWVWLAPSATGASASMALSSNRRALDTDREFEQLKARLLTPEESRA